MNAPVAPPGAIATAAGALRRGALSSVSLVDASLAAIARDGARTRAFTMVDADGAYARARDLDRELAHGHDRGPLHGIPISLKDLIDVSGVVTTAGSRVMRQRVASADAPVVTRLVDAGAVILGRTNLHEFALGTTSEDSAFGAVCHPADTTRVAGGSSGGSAVAVATGMGLGSIGTDTGGSVRIPAAACGVVGLKGTHGDVPTGGVVPLSRTLDHVGPLATSVQDAAWLWQVLAGLAPAAVRPLTVGRLRFRTLDGYFDRPLDPVVRAAYGHALARLRAAGVDVAPTTIESTDLIAPTYTDIVLPEAAAWHGDWLDTRADEYLPAVRARIADGRAISAVRYLTAIAGTTALRAIVDAALADCDALVLPTLPLQAPPLGASALIVDPADTAPIPIRAAMLKHTQLFNLTGHPAISLPVATSGLPVGLQLVGRRYDTPRLLDIAAACELLVVAS